MNELSKPYELTLEMRPEYLYARVRSKATSQEMVVAYIHEVIRKCKKLNRRRLLLERDIPATLGDKEVFFSGTDFAHMGLADVKIAVVDRRAENIEGLELAILVQNNRGANIMLFDNVPEAESWLVSRLPHLAHLERLDAGEGAQ